MLITPLPSTQLADGSCPKSYGFHVAMLAGLPRSIVDVARRKSEEMQKSSKDLEAFRLLMDQSIDDPTANASLAAALMIE